MITPTRQRRQSSCCKREAPNLAQARAERIYLAEWMKIVEAKRCRRDAVVFCGGAGA